MKLRLAQLVVTTDIEQNYTKILSAIESTEEGEWVVFPEGMLCGYYPEDPDYIEKINFDLITAKATELAGFAKSKKIVIIVGTAWKDGESIYNSTLFISPTKTERYDKANLANLDRNHFKEGSKLTVYQYDNIPFGIQMCRDLVFPEQWKLLKIQGAQIIFHINNAIKVTDKNRENMVWSRAFENQLFICSVNNAASPQAQKSQLIDPTGQIIWESVLQEEVIRTIEFDISSVRTDYLEQARTDLVQVIGK